jgi:hypothetical protein
MPRAHTIGRVMAQRHHAWLGRTFRGACLIASLGGGTIAASGIVTASPASAASSSFTIPGLVDAITQPLANGTMWVLITLNGREAIYQVNVKTHRVLAGEEVSSKADDIALSSNGSTLVVGTTSGAYAAEVWYNGKTGRYINSASSPTPVDRVAINAAGNSIYALRGTGTTRGVFAVGTANALGYPYPLPVNAVGITPALADKGLEVLQPNGIVGHLAFNGGVYTNQFSTGGPAMNLVLSPDGTTLYVLRAETSLATSDTIGEVNMAQGKLVKSFTTNQYCADIAISPDGHTLYEALRGVKSTIKAVPVP